MSTVSYVYKDMQSINGCHVCTLGTRVSTHSAAMANYPPITLGQASCK